MPIPVVCPKCQTRLNAPDQAAGKKVKCPKCADVLAVPAPVADPEPLDLPPEPPPPPPPPAASGNPFDFDAAPPPPPPPKPAPRPAARPAAPPPPPVASGDPFAFDATSPPPPPARRAAPKPEVPADLPPDDEPPRPRGRSAEGPSKAKVWLVVAAVVLVCGAAGGFGTYFVWTKLGGKGPPGWKIYAAKDGSFKAYFPVAPEDKAMPSAGGGKGPEPEIKTYVAQDKANDQMAGVIVFKFPGDFPAQQRSTIMDTLGAFFGKGATGKDDAKDVTWLGQNGKELVLREPNGKGEMLMRQALVGNTGYVAIVAFKGARKQDVSDAFFNSFEALSK